jgi:hypothetical protein
LPSWQYSDNIKTVRTLTGCAQRCAHLFDTETVA